MAKSKQIYDKEKSDYYGSDRKPLGKKGYVFKDKKKYNRKKKYKNWNETIQDLIKDW